MRKETESNINEVYYNVKPHLDNERTTEELREMCQNCEAYCGSEHEYGECEDKMCFKFWLAFKYLEWINGYR